MKLSIIPIIIIGLCANGLQAAEKRSVRDMYNRVSIMSGKTASTGEAQVIKQLGLSVDVEGLKVRKKYVDKNGDTTIRYTQTYKGVPVAGDDVIISRRRNGELKRVHGFVVNGIAQDVMDVEPSITASEALRIAKKASLPKSETQAKTAAVGYELESSRLVIWLNDAGIAQLVYEVSFVQHADKLSRPHFFIDAKSGEVLDYYDNLQSVNAKGPGGNQKTGIYHYGTDYGYLNIKRSGSTCSMENSMVMTVDLNHRDIVNDPNYVDQPFTFSCPAGLIPENTHKSINGAYSPLNDAHNYGTVIYDMYKNWLGRAPLPYKLVMRVHYKENLENAFWYGGGMLFGDGQTKFYPLVSLDVASHEVAHGFTENNSGLIYKSRFGIPAAINESFSDMAGEAADYYKYGSSDWKVGADITKQTDAMRYLNNPPLDGHSIDHRSNYVSTMDAHHSSGVLNKAFYNLATSPGWNTKKAFLVYARANMLYWSASIGWDEAGNGAMDAACDLGYDTNAVRKSLSAVGVNATLSPGSLCGIVATAYVDSNNMACAWYGNNYASCGSTTDLDSVRTKYRYSLPPGYSPSDIVDIGWVDSYHMACAWYKNGMVSCGSTRDLDSIRAPYRYTLPSGYTTARIKGIGWVSSKSMACAYYDNRRFSCGSTRDLDSKRSLKAYSLPPGYGPSDILGMAWVTPRSMGCAWYDNGNVSCGATTDLDSVRSPRPYTTAR